MKILYTHRTQGVGAEGAHIKGMYEAFRNLGHSVSMLCLPGCNPSEVAPAGASASGPMGATRDTSKATATGLRRFYRVIADGAPQVLFEMIELGYNGLLFAQMLGRCLAARPDLIYERYSLNNFAPTLVARLFGIPHVLEVNDSVVIQRSRPLVLRWLSQRIEGWCLRNADLNITITEEFGKKLQARFGQTFKLEVMTNGVARDRFDRTFKREELRTALGLDNATVLGGTGQFLSWHGLHDLVGKLGPQVQARNLRFLFIGDGPARDEVMAVAQRLGIAERVHITGMQPIDSVPDLLSALDIAVVPNAAVHASPMKLIEYMAMGLPIVAPDLPSIRAAVGEGMGRIFPAGDMEAMKACIEDLLADPSAARELGRRAREHVFDELTWDHHVLKVLAILGMRA